MVSQIAEQIRLSLEEWSGLYDSEGPFEYVEGKRIKLSPNTLGHILLARMLNDALSAYGKSSKRGFVLTESPFVKTEESNWVKGSRVPDLMFILAERLNTYLAQTENAKNKPLILIPDLAIEIISPGDIYSDVDEKVAEYLADGVQAVWVVNPRNQSIKVQRAGKADVRFKTGEILTDELLPEFSLALATVFSDELMF